MYELGKNFARSRGPWQLYLKVVDGEGHFKDSRLALGIYGAAFYLFLEFFRSA